jgi:hypothetical protein
MLGIWRVENMGWYDLRDAGREGFEAWKTFEMDVFTTQLRSCGKSNPVVNHQFWIVYTTHVW